MRPLLYEDLTTRSHRRKYVSFELLCHSGKVTDSRGSRQDIVSRPGTGSRNLVHERGDSLVLPFLTIHNGRRAKQDIASRRERGCFPCWKGAMCSLNSETTVLR